MNSKKRRLYLLGGLSCFGVLLATLLMVLFINLFFKADMAEHPETTSVVLSTVEYEQHTTLPLPQNLHRVIYRECARYGIDPAIVYAVIEVESRGDTAAESSEGCIGLMQLNQQYENAFVEGAGVNDITTPENNVKAGIWWLSELLNEHGEADLALIAYNIGSEPAKALWENGIKDTDGSYVEKVKEAMEWTY